MKEADMIPTIDTSFDLRCFTDGHGNTCVYVPQYNLTVTGGNFAEAKAEATRRVAALIEAEFLKSMSPPSRFQLLWQRFLGWVKK